MRVFHSRSVYASTCWRETWGCCVTTRRMNCHRRERSGVYFFSVCVYAARRRCFTWNKGGMKRGRRLFSPCEKQVLTKWIWATQSKNKDCHREGEREKHMRIFSFLPPLTFFFIPHFYCPLIKSPPLSPFFLVLHIPLFLLLSHLAASVCHCPFYPLSLLSPRGGMKH